MAKLGDLAASDDYGYSDLGIPIGGPRVARDPREGLPDWALNTLEQRPHYEPQATMWPNPNARRADPEATPDPLVPFSNWRVKPPKRTAGAVAGDIASALVPTDPIDIGAAIATGGGSIPLRMGALALGAALQPGEAEGAGGARIIQPYVTGAIRNANPGIYKRPDVIAAEAAARVAPEHPALRELFGVTRDDLYQISQGGKRQGNKEPELWMPKRAPREGERNAVGAAIANDANAQRLVDTLGEAYKHPDLVKGMVPWYVMDPAYQHMVRLFGKERAAKEYMDFNMSITPFSAGSPVPTELNRGTAANMMRMRGEYPIFQRYGGLSQENRSADFPEILRDVKGGMGHANMADPVARYMATGSHGYGKDKVKINLYSGASGVPETGFQTRWPVPDAHFARAVGAPDVRTSANYNDYMKGTEYRETGPWFREKVAKPLGIEAVPGQALTWGVYAPQTGVKTPIGAGKLELLAQNIWERAAKLGIDPRQLRDDVLTGKAHASWLMPGLVGAGVMGGLARQDEYQQ